MFFDMALAKCRLKDNSYCKNILYENDCSKYIIPAFKFCLIITREAWFRYLLRELFKWMKIGKPLAITWTRSSRGKYLIEKSMCL